MNAELTSHAEHCNSAVVRISYMSPVLRVYGAVTDITRGSATMCNDALTGMLQTGGNCGSDARIKENLVLIGTHHLGFGLYLFDYKAEFQNIWGRGRQFGVVADEVETILPNAVSMHASGFKQVNYALLGIGRVQNQD
jgi:hypothetical protein